MEKIVYSFEGPEVERVDIVTSFDGSTLQLLVEEKKLPRRKIKVEFSVVLDCQFISISMLDIIPELCFEKITKQSAKEFVESKSAEFSAIFEGNFSRYRMFLDDIGLFDIVSVGCTVGSEKL